MKVQSGQKSGSCNYLPIEPFELEILDWESMGIIHESFRVNIIEKPKNVTDIIYDEILNNILNAKIPRSFVIVINGKIGRKTGILKTALGIQYALKMAEESNIEIDLNKHLAFTPDELCEKIEKYGSGIDKRRIIWILDERIRDKKRGAYMRLANVIESCREKQFCFILIGVPESEFTIQDYSFERLGESSDFFLPNKTVYFAVDKKVETAKNYIGYIKYNLIPLTDKKWGYFWNKEYMPLKQQHEENVIGQRVSMVNIDDRAISVIKSNEFKEFLNISIDEGRTLTKSQIRLFVYKKYPDLTVDERDMIVTQIQNNQK